MKMERIWSDGLADLVFWATLEGLSQKLFNSKFCHRLGLKECRDLYLGNIVRLGHYPRYIRNIDDMFWIRLWPNYNWARLVPVKVTVNSHLSLLEAVEWAKKTYYSTTKFLHSASD